MRLVCPCLPLFVDYLFVLSLQETLRVRSSLQLLTLKPGNFKVSQLVSLKERLQLGGFISVGRCLMAQLRFNVVYFFLELVGTTVSKRDLLSRGIFKVGFLIFGQTARGLNLLHLIL